MKGDDFSQEMIFSYLSPEARVPQDHPLRYIKAIVNDILKSMEGELRLLYSTQGRPSIPPEKLLRALLLQALFTVRSERQLMEQLHYNLLFRWFVGLSMDEPVWNPSTFSKNRERLLGGDIAYGFLAAVVERAQDEGWLSQEHFTVDGTLIEAWASHNSFKPKKDASSAEARKEESDDSDDSHSDDFHGQRRSNKTHQSTTDPEARLCRKGPGKEAKLAFHAHVLMENRNGLVVNACVTPATGTAEREAALDMMKTIRGPARMTLGADKNYDTNDLVKNLREIKVTPHVASKRYSAIDGRTRRHAGYEISQIKRKGVEKIFGWLKTVAPMRKTRHRGVGRVDWMIVLSFGAYNLVRMRNLSLAQA